MRAAQFPVAVLGIFTMCGWGVAQDVSANSLKCEVEGDTAVALCSAVQADLSKRNQMDDASHLILIASEPRRYMLRAQIDIVRGAQRHAGQQGELTVMDRNAIAPRQLNDFAKALVDRAGLTTAPDP